MSFYFALWFMSSHILHASFTCYSYFPTAKHWSFFPLLWLAYASPTFHFSLIDTHIHIDSRSNFAYFSYPNKTTSKSRVWVWIYSHCNNSLPPLSHVVVANMVIGYQPETNIILCSQVYCLSSYPRASRYATCYQTILIKNDMLVVFGDSILSPPWHTVVTSSTCLLHTYPHQ